MTSLSDLGLAIPQSQETAEKPRSSLQSLGLSIDQAPAAQSDVGIGRIASDLWSGLKNYTSGLVEGVEGKGIPAGPASKFSGGRAGFGGRMLGTGARSIGEGLWEAIKTPGQYLSGEKRIGPGSIDDALRVAPLMLGQGRVPMVTEAEPSAAALALRNQAGGGPNPFQPQGGGKIEPLPPTPPSVPVISTGPQPPHLTGAALPEQRPGVPQLAGGSVAPLSRPPPVINTGPQPPHLTGQAIPAQRPGVPVAPGGLASSPTILPEYRQPGPLPLSGQPVGPMSAGTPRPSGGRVGRLVEAIPTSPLADAIAKNDGTAVDRLMAQRYRGAVKPKPIDGKPGLAGLTEQDRRLTTAVDMILDNRGDLRVTDLDTGQKIPFPKNPGLYQFAEALDQTKRSVFKLYDQLSARADAAGVRVDLAPVIAKAHEIANGVVARDLSPATRAEALRLASVMESKRFYTPLEAQDMIEGINEISKSFWRRGGSPQDTTIVGVQNQLAHVLRTQLDHAIDTQGGPSYQALKLRYQALRSVEQEVATAVLKQANKPGGGMPYELADLVSAEQFIHGVIDPTHLVQHAGRGLATMAAKKAMRFLKDPNRAIGRMFEAREYATKKPPYKIGRADSYQMPATNLLAPLAGSQIPMGTGPNGGKVIGRTTVSP